MSDAPAAIPWYKSHILQMLCVAAVTRALVHFHIADTFSSADIALFVDNVLDAIGAASLGYAAYSRTKHPTPAVTTTQAKADVVNSVGTPAIAPVPLPEKPS
jgi:hypothetical protein